MGLDKRTGFEIFQGSLLERSLRGPFGIAVGRTKRHNCINLFGVDQPEADIGCGGRLGGSADKADEESYL